MAHNIALLSQIDREKIKIDLMAAGLSFKKRHGLTADTTSEPKSGSLQELFFRRLVYYQEISRKLARTYSSPTKGSTRSLKTF